MVLLNVSLADKYTLEKGRVFLTGTQALVRLPMMQQLRDTAAGYDTACYISGYRGSPLGGYDQQLDLRRRSCCRNIRSLPAGRQRGPRCHSLLGHTAGALPRARTSTTACSPSGTARDRAWTAPATLSVTAIWPARTQWVACSC